MSSTTPAKGKKLVQARLPFLSANSPGSPISNVNKKRKLATPSPNSIKNEKAPKIPKISKKENIIGKEKDENKAESSDDIEIIEIDKGSPVKAKNSESGALLKFLQKGSKPSSTPPKPITEIKDKLTANVDSKIPRIVLDRCDKSEEGRVSPMDLDGVTKLKSSQEKETIEVEIEIDDEQVVDDENEKKERVKCKDKMVDDEETVDKEDTKEKDVSDEEVIEKNEKEVINHDETIDDSNDQSIVQTDLESELSSSEDEDEEDEVKKDLDDNKKEKTKTDEISSSEDENEGNEKIEKSEDAKEKNQVKETKKVLKEGLKKSMTPKQLARHMSKLKRLEEIEKQKNERREERKKLRAIKEAEKEQKRKEKDLKKQMDNEQRQKEKEKIEKAKEEERRKREEAKEEEKRKKEEEKLKAERKKQKAAESFASFFVTKKQETKPLVEDKIIRANNFMPFEIKADMKVAPICRRVLKDVEKSTLDVLFSRNNLNYEQLYLKQIKNNDYKTGRSGKTYSIELKDDVVILDDDDLDSDNVISATNVTDRHRAKLLLFTENRRPPYWGTWRKKSGIINPRKPFTKDIKWFDYEIDSDDEWEEEEPGESLRGSDDEKDEENPDDDEYDVDNEFMVPHGYLSDEEARQDDEDQENISPEIQKCKLKLLGEQFEAEMKAKTCQLKPKVIGCVWLNADNSYPEHLSQRVVEFLKAREAWTYEIPINLSKIAKVENETTNSTEASSTSTSSAISASKKTKVPDEAIPDLIRLIHGNVRGSKFLIKEFITYWHKNHNESLSKASLSTKIRELAKRMACPDEGEMHLKHCWYVSEDIRKKYLNQDLTVPNQWTYILTPDSSDKSKANVDTSEVGDKEDKEIEKEKEKEKEKKNDQDNEKSSKDKQKKSEPLITQFTKKVTQEEMKKQLLVKPTPTQKPSVSLNRPPKRVALISVPRGESTSKDSNKFATFKALQIPTTDATTTTTTTTPANTEIQIQQGITDTSQKMDVDPQQSSSESDQQSTSNESKDKIVQKADDKTTESSD